MLGVMAVTERSIEELKARADEFADAFESYEPQPGDEKKALPPLMAMKLAAWRRDMAEKDLAEAVAAARREGVSWLEVGETLGTGTDAAQERYGAHTSDR